MNISTRIKLDKAKRRITFYICNFIAYHLPASFLKLRMRYVVSRLTEQEKKQVKERTAYYNKLSKPHTFTDFSEKLPSGTTGEQVCVKDFKLRAQTESPQHTSYFYALSPFVRCCKSNNKMQYLFGDVTETPFQPTFVKSRPINTDNANAVIMKLDGIRHFMFIKDCTKWKDKKNIVVSRNHVSQPHRILLLRTWFGHELCDFGQTNKDINEGHPEWIQPFMSIEDQLKYKFIMCTEGNDVATNLKWVMSSNSIAVMPKPHYETWFMEGTLKADYHYIEVKDDYSDLIEKINYYISHPDEAEAIIQHAHEYVNQFKNKRIELATQLSVAQSYFEHCN